MVEDVEADEADHTDDEGDDGGFDSAEHFVIPYADLVVTGWAAEYADEPINKNGGDEGKFEGACAELLGTLQGVGGVDIGEESNGEEAHGR
jgi:hypothetical protein